MKSSDQAVAEILARQRPMLCLDTCGVLDVVRRLPDPSPKQANIYNARSFRRALQMLAIDPDSFQVVVTYLVRHEWGQNVQEARSKVEQHLSALDLQIDRVAEACGLGRISAPSQTARFGTIGWWPWRKIS